MSKSQRVPSIANDNPLLVAQWLVTAIPTQHPLWWHYDVRVISLADWPDTPPAYKAFPEATHEIAVVALDSKANPVYGNPRGFVHLMPLNYVRQIVVASDDDAIEVTQQVVNWFVCGRCLLEIQGILGAKELNDHYVDAAVKRRAKGLPLSDR